MSSYPTDDKPFSVVVPSKVSPDASARVCCFGYLQVMSKLINPAGGSIPADLGENSAEEVKPVSVRFDFELR